MCRLEWKFIVVLLACASFFCVNESATKKPAVPLDRLVYPDELDSHRSGVELQTSYFHHGHPQDEDYDDRAEGKPGNSLASGMMNPKDDNVTRIPIGLIREINDKGYTINDLLVHYVEDYDDFLQIFLNGIQNTSDFNENRIFKAEIGARYQERCYKKKYIDSPYHYRKEITNEWAFMENNTIIKTQKVGD